MKRWIMVLIGAMIIVNLKDVVYAHSYKESFNYDAKIKNVSDAEEFIQRYFEEQHLNIELGSSEYVEYLTNILMFEDDEDLKQLSQYDDFKIYASEYLNQINNLSNNTINEKKVLMSKKEGEKTISEIKKEARNEELVVQKITKDREKASKTMLFVNGYNSSKSVKYARKWANDRNPLYNSYLSDCTNFVSQCIYAGGEPMTKPGNMPDGVKETTNYWYSVRYEDWHGNNFVYNWRESSSFIRVTDLYTYWVHKGAHAEYYSNKTKLQNGVSIGNVVQLKNGDGKWFHSIIITGGEKGDRKYCGHSSNRKDEPVKNISGAVSYRALKF